MLELKASEAVALRGAKGFGRMAGATLKEKHRSLKWRVRKVWKQTKDFRRFHRRLEDLGLWHAQRFRDFLESQAAPHLGMRAQIGSSRGAALRRVDGSPQRRRLPPLPYEAEEAARLAATLDSAMGPGFAPKTSAAAEAGRKAAHEEDLAIKLDTIRGRSKSGQYMQDTTESRLRKIEKRIGARSGIRLNKALPPHL